LSHPRILVVDDDPGIRSVITEQLATKGYESRAAADGREGIDSFRRDRPDLVLTDLAMPGVDGFELIRRVREVSTVPIIVLSVRGGDSDKVHALDLGADDYIVKPFSMIELLARVRAQMRRSS
jgi:DNA-binding response OmpR family regulator